MKFIYQPSEARSPTYRGNHIISPMPSIRRPAALASLIKRRPVAMPQSETFQNDETKAKFDQRISSRDDVLSEDDLSMEELKMVDRVLNFHNGNLSEACRASSL